LPTAAPVGVPLLQGGADAGTDLQLDVGRRSGAGPGRLDPDGISGSSACHGRLPGGGPGTTVSPIRRHPCKRV